MHTMQFIYKLMIIFLETVSAAIRFDHIRNRFYFVCIDHVMNIIVSAAQFIIIVHPPHIESNS